MGYVSITDAVEFLAAALGASVFAPFNIPLRGGEAARGFAEQILSVEVKARNDDFLGQDVRGDVDERGELIVCDLRQLRIGHRGQFSHGSPISFAKRNAIR
jgi:hypothetical protein